MPETSDTQPVRNTEAPLVEASSAKGPGLSARQEKFCQLYVSGRTATEAYREAYGNTRTARVAASRLLTSVNVRARVEDLRAEAARGAVLTLQLKREFLRRVVLTPIGEVHAESDLCQKYEAHPCDNGMHLKVSMPDKLKAIEIDAKLAGEFKDLHGERPEKVDGLTELLGKIRSGAV